MNLQEAQAIASICGSADGGCTVCVRSLVELLQEFFPEFEWIYDGKTCSDSVTVMEKENNG